MAVFKSTDWEIEAKFDEKACRHYLNDELTVFHCHHFTTLYTQMAMDADEAMGSIRHLINAAEEAFYVKFEAYFKQRADLTIADKAKLVEQYYAVAGLGKMEINALGQDGGEVTLHFSHVDAGWLKKWGKHDCSVNFITCGFLSAAFSAIFGKAIGAYNVFERESIVMGAEKSRFVVARA